jgi:hypothetical protein
MPGQVKAIVPKDFDAKAVEAVLRREMEKFAPALMHDFEKTTSMWRGAKPTFTAHLVINNVSISVQIHVVGKQEGRDKWNWLNEGTKPHKIRAKPGNKKGLRFRKGYQAGSSPNSTFTMRATQAKGAWVRKMEVNHPGFPARNWSAIIAEREQRPFTGWMETAMREAARASGHGMK